MSRSEKNNTVTIIYKYKDTPIKGAEFSLWENCGGRLSRKAHCRTNAYGRAYFTTQIKEGCTYFLQCGKIRQNGVTYETPSFCFKGSGIKRISPRAFKSGPKTGLKTT